MSHIDHDDAFVNELRAIADAEQPTLSLDASAVTRGGRARRRRRAVAGGTLTTLAGAAVVVGLTQVDDIALYEAAPAAPNQEARSFGDDHTVEVAPGVVAANRPVTITVAGRSVQDLGFTSRITQFVGESETPPMPSVLETVETTFAEETDPASGPTGMTAQLFNVLDDALYGGPSFGWLDDESPENYSTVGNGSWTLSSMVGMPGWSHEQLVLGSVPSWLDEPRVMLFSERGFTSDDGVEHALEVPTFRALSDDDRLVFAAKITEEQGEFRGTDPEFAVDAVVYTDRTGEVFVGDQCGPAGVDSCLERFGGAFRSVLESETFTEAAGPFDPDGNLVPVTTRTTADAEIRDVADVISHLSFVPGTTSTGDTLLPWAVAPHGGIVATMRPPDPATRTQERIGLWSAGELNEFGDVLDVPAGETHSAATDGTTSTWAENPRTEDTARWRVFSHTSETGSRLVARAEDTAEPDTSVHRDFGGPVAPQPFGHRVVWTSAVNYSTSSEPQSVLLSAPADGSGPMRIESPVDSNVVVTRRGAVFVREGGAEVVMLRHDGRLEDLLRYTFDDAPEIRLAGNGDTLVIAVRPVSGKVPSWVDTIDLTTMTVTRVELPRTELPHVHACTTKAVWTYPATGDSALATSYFVDLATAELWTVPAEQGALVGCGGTSAMWTSPERDPSGELSLTRLR